MKPLKSAYIGLLIALMIALPHHASAQNPKAPFALEDIRRMQRLRPANPFDKSGDYRLLEAWEMLAQQDSTKPSSPWWQELVLGKILPLGKGWSLGLDGLANIYLGSNVTDGSIMGYELVASRQTKPGYRWVLRSAHNWALARKRYLTDNHLLYFYAPERSGQLILSAGRTTGKTSHSSNEEEFAENFLTPLGTNNPLHHYEKDYLGIRNSLYLTPQLHTSLQVLYEQRKPLYADLSQPYNTLHSELRLAYNFSRYGSSSATYHSADRLPRGFFFPEIGLTYRLTYYTPSSSSDGRTYPNTIHSGVAGQSIELSMRMAYAFSDYRRLDWAIVGESFLCNTKHLMPEDHRYLSFVEGLDRKPLSNAWATGEYISLTRGAWLWGRVNYGGGRLALAHIPLMQRLLIDEQLHLRGLIGTEGQRWLEAGYSLGLGNMLRVGCFYGTDLAGNNAISLRCTVPLLYLISRASTRY